MNQMKYSIPFYTMEIFYAECQKTFTIQKFMRFQNKIYALKGIQMEEINTNIYHLMGHNFYINDN